MAQLDRDRVRCYACGHECPIPDGAVGVCKVRFNRGGRLFVPWGYVGGVQCDPIEKKPFFHVLPRRPRLQLRDAGVRSALLVLPELGDLARPCATRRRWRRRSTPRRSRSSDGRAPRRRQDRGQHLQRAAHHLRVGGRRVHEARKQRAALTAFVSNGNGTPQVLQYLRPHVDLYKVDLKSFNDRHYRAARRTPAAHPRHDRVRYTERGVWLEIVTLLIPGFNDGDEELRALTTFLASVSPDIPWHVTAFHQDYKMTDPPNTPPATLMRAAAIGRRGRAALHLRRQPSRARQRSRAHVLSHLRRDADRPPRLPDHRYRLTQDGACPLRMTKSRPMGHSLRRADHVHAVSAGNSQASDDLTRDAGPETTGVQNRHGPAAAFALRGYGEPRKPDATIGFEPPVDQIHQRPETRDRRL